ncbi:hypothetical protein V5799_012765 [Amblyomma americanum]|uniref:Organic cation/carnitine transporter n=1 Tax=Amblyomma americanum TaxID=6943 RepID=A0AAQ4E7X8_AMBAM
MDASSCAPSSYASSAKRAREGSIAIEDSLLDGFVTQYSLAGIQESVYIVLGHSAHQRRFLTCGILCVAAPLLQFKAYQLIGRPVDHWCRPPKGLAHLSAEAWKNLSIPVEADGSFSQCTMYDTSELNRYFNTIALVILILKKCYVSNATFLSVSRGPQDSLLENRTAVPCHKWDYDIADKRNSIVSLFDLVCERRRLYDLSSLAYVVGYTFLAPVAGFVSDRVGKRSVLLACAFVLLLSSVGSSAAAMYASLVVTRIVAVSTGSATYILTFILLHEVTGNAWRSLFTLLHTALAATVVPPLLHAVSLLEPRWLLAQGLLLVPMAMCVTWCCLQEESPAWLLTTGNMRDAAVAILTAAQLNGLRLAEAAVIRRDYNPAIPFVHAGMKVAVSVAISVALCFVGYIFPTHIRSIGVSLSIFFGGAETLSSVSLIMLSGRNANAAFSMFAAFTTMLSIGVVHWLPEVFIEKPKKAAPIRAMTEMERKEELKKSLSFFAVRKKGKSQERQPRLTNASAP